MTTGPTAASPLRMYFELCAAAIGFGILIGGVALAALVAFERTGELTTVFAALAAVVCGSISAAALPAWAVRQSAQTFAATALLSLGVRLMVTLVAALLIQRLGGFGDSLLWFVGLAQFLMLGCDTAYLIRAARRIRGEK